MKISFFDSSLETLSLMKNIVKDFPEHEYFFYADTLNGPYRGKTKEELQMPITHALRYCMENKSDAVCVGSDIPIALIEQNMIYKGTSILILSPSTLKDYMYSISTSFKTEDFLEKKRNIHLTKHSSEYDMQIATILGGQFLGS